VKGKRFAERAFLGLLASAVLVRSATIVAFGGPRLELAFQTGLVVGAGLVWVQRP
jgi:hypothetical protein